MFVDWELGCNNTVDWESGCNNNDNKTAHTGNLPPSGEYEVDITSLEPGPHLFIITVDDGYGKSVMKIYPFSIGTGTYNYYYYYYHYYLNTSKLIHY